MLKLKTPWHNGTTNIVMLPLEFLHHHVAQASGLRPPPTRDRFNAINLDCPVPALDRYQPARSGGAAGQRSSPERNEGRPLVSKEPVVLNNLPKRGSGKPSNVTLRGTGPTGLLLRPQVKVVEGRSIVRPGSSEVIAACSIAAGFQGVILGGTLRFGGRDWTVVGLFDASKSGFDSEIWLDAEQLMAAFRHQNWSSMIARLSGVDRFDDLRQRIDTDPRSTLDTKREKRFYADQSESLANFIRILGTSLAVIFSIGAVVGAMITMFGSVASRIGEIGTLRALGFRRSAVLSAFMGEALLLSLLSGVAGPAGATLMQAVSVFATNFATLSELAFQFTMTPAIAFQSILFALFMGLVGGFIPAWRAARLKILDCLREA